MEMNAPTIVYAVVAISLLLIPVLSQEVEDERSFSYELGADDGPERWGLIHKDWEACNHGELQSPIDLSSSKVAVLHSAAQLHIAYRPSNGTIMNRGHDIMLKFRNGAGRLRLNDTDYVLKQLHWHSPSEHTLNNHSFAMEMHMVHQSIDEKKVAVVGILYKFGRPDHFLSKMEEHINQIDLIEGDEEAVGVVDVRHLIRHEKEYYRYMGSLTVPPCTQGVVWTIMKRDRTVSIEQVKLLRDIVNDGWETNARPTQPTNERVIRLYRPRKAGF